MNIAEILRRSSAAYAEQPAIVLGNQCYTSYRRLYQRVAAIAHYLREQLGLSVGERVAIAMDNRPQYIEVMFAAWHAGLVVVPMNAKLHMSEFVHIFRDSEAAICFTNQKLYQQFSQHQQQLPASLRTIYNVENSAYLQLIEGKQLALAPRAANDLAWLFYTSGTTGRPKGAMQSHRNLYGIIHGFLSQVKAVNCQDAIYHGAPMSHGGGYYILPFIAKGGVQLIPPSGAFNMPELLSMLENQHSVSFFAAPTMVKKLIEYPGVKRSDFSALDTIIYGGGPMYASILEHAHQLLGNKLVQIYGQGECPMNITVLDLYQHQVLALQSSDHSQRLVSVGLPHFAIQVKVVDEDGNAVACGVAGEIIVMGDTVMLGYWRNQTASEQSLKQGWLYTGDIGYLDEDGFLFLTDRSKDVIISGGSNIYPREVEEVLLKHPQVGEASVIGVADLEWGEIVVAYVAIESNSTLNSAALEQYCLQHMARFKRPKQYHFIDELPKNSTGKILKTELRKLQQTL